MPVNSCPLCQPVNETVLAQDRLTRVIQVGDLDWPGFHRVIYNDHSAEMTDLAGPEQQAVLQQVLEQESALRQHFQPDKINLASLGNMVPHLHWHVICRWRTDPYWPASLWSAPRTAQTIDVDGLSVQIDQWAALSTQARSVRHPVFVVGQAVTEAEEWDGLDPVSRHAIIVQNEQGLATGRLLSMGSEMPGVARIGRMAVLEAHRGKGLGLAILQALVTEARHLAFNDIILHAQLHALAFYERAGFVAEGPTFEECRIQHRQMRLTLKEAA